MESPQATKLTPLVGSPAKLGSTPKRQKQQEIPQVPLFPVLAEPTISPDPELKQKMAEVKERRKREQQEQREQRDRSVSRTPPKLIGAQKSLKPEDDIGSNVNSSECSLDEAAKFSGIRGAKQGMGRSWKSGSSVHSTT